MSTAVISAGELLAQLSDPELILLDVRPVAAFNGWRLAGEARGGHIPGAIPFPHSWLKTASRDEAHALLSAREMSDSKKVILYGYESDDSHDMAGRLRAHGFADLFIYEAGLPEWAAESTLPMSRLANGQQLVHAAWLEQLIAGEGPEAGPKREWLIIEVAWQGRDAYESGHIPGAVYLDTEAIEKEPLLNRINDGPLEELLLALGIHHNVTVVLYGRDPMAAARLAVICLYAGVKDVRLLDGGFAAWTRAGYPVERGYNKPQAAGGFGRPFPGRPEIIIDTPEVKVHLAGETAVLVSVRSWAEYIGRSSGYPFIQAKGRIPGAVWGQGGSDPYHLESYRNEDNTLANYHQIAAFWQAKGITPEKQVIFSCGTGWRASEVFFYAYLMGWPRIALYDGGWLEWSLDESNPVEIGLP